MLSDKDFLINRKILFVHLYLSWKFIVFFTVWYSLLTFFLISDNGGNNKYIAPNIILNKKMIYNDGVLNGAGIFTLGCMGATVSVITSVALMNRTFTNDIDTGKIRLLLMNEFSKKQIFFSKILYIWIVLILMFVPQFFYQIIFGAQANDFKDYIGVIIFQNISMLILEFSLATFICFVSIVCGSYYLISYFISAILVFFVYISFFIVKDAEPEIYNLLSKVFFLRSVSNLDLFSFTHPDIPTVKNPITFGYLINTINWVSYIKTLFGILFILLGLYASYQIFKRRDFQNA